MSLHSCDTPQPTSPHPTSLHYCADNVSNNKSSVTLYEVTAVSGGSSVTFLVLKSTHLVRDDLRELHAIFLHL